MTAMSEAQEKALGFAPFIITGPWPSLRGPMCYGIQTVEQDPMRWDVRQHWPAVVRRLVRKGRLVRDGEVYRRAIDCTSQA